MLQANANYDCFYIVTHKLYKNVLKHPSPVAPLCGTIKKVDKMEVEEMTRKASIEKSYWLLKIYCSLPRRFNKGDVFTLAGKFCQQWSAW